MLNNLYQQANDAFEEAEKVFKDLENAKNEEAANSSNLSKLLDRARQNANQNAWINRVKPQNEENLAWTVPATQKLTEKQKRLTIYAEELKVAICLSDYAISKSCPPNLHGEPCPSELPKWDKAEHHCSECWKKWWEDNVEMVCDE